MERLRRIKGPTVGLLLIGLLALLLMIVANLWNGQQAQQAFDVVNASREIRATTVNLGTALLSAESSQRGFVITGNEIYLAPFGTATNQAALALRKLTDLLAGDPASAPKIVALQALVTEKIAELTDTVDLLRSGKAEEAAEIIRSHRGKALMDETNVFLSAIVRAAEARIGEGVADQQDSFRTLRLVTYVAVLMVIAVTAGVYLLVRTFVGDLRKANSEVQLLNCELERRVEERTFELAQARDRAEVLLAEVNHRVANSLTMVASMVGMQARASTSIETRALLADTQARINAVAVVHKQLYTSGDVKTVALSDFLPKLLAQIEGALNGEGLSATLRTEIEPQDMETDRAISLGIILTEWVTNAFKYAYPGKSGEIRVKLHKEPDGAAQVSVEDDGVGRDNSAAPQGTGLGTRLVSAMANSLGARIEYSDRRPGTEARLWMPAHV
jgi:two-component sensor histidine kinase